MDNDFKEQREKLLNLVRDVVAHDKALREQYQIGDKFRFIRDRLDTLLAQLEENLQTMLTASEEKTVTLKDDELLVYVYIYNSQGLNLKTWQKMLSPSVFYEYSVNRPIYSEKAHIESLLRNKPNRAQHGYMTIAIKKNEVLAISEDEISKDVNENLVIKIREGSLHLEKMVSFSHNGHDYILNAEGELVRKI